MTPRRKWLLFFGVLIVPFVIGTVTTSVAFKRARSVQFCGSCHVMKPYVSDLQNSASDSLASRHYQHRYVNQNQCYTCHTDYDFLGPLEAKWRGLRHVLAYYSGSKRAPRLYKPYLNQNCLQCHRGEKSFLASPTHSTLLDQILANEISCMSCHGPVHKKEGSPS